MPEDLTIVADNWMELAGAGKDLPVPFAKELLLLECHVAGTLHVDDILMKTESLDGGSPLHFRRDPNNPFDDMAIAVLNAKGERIGWVPRKHNPILARLMDAGKLLVGKVVSKKLEDHWLNLRMEIFMRDI